MAKRRSEARDGDEATDVERMTQSVDEEMPPRLPFPVVGIGASAGGLEALSELVATLDPASGMAYVIVQHLPPDRESLMAEILSRRTTLPVREVCEGEAVERDTIFLIRPGRTLTMKDGCFHLGDPVEKPGHRRPIDDFFRSLAAEQRERAIAVILSGMGSNGTSGAMVIKTVGGLCIAQDPDTAAFPSMPRRLIESGYADFIARPADIPAMLGKYAGHPYSRGGLGADAFRDSRQSINEIIGVIRARTRLDFTGYKKPTLIRRIQRRMGLNQVVKIEDYAKLLRQVPGEVHALADDLTIHVSGFFRDPEAWEVVRQRVVVPLVAERDQNASIRCWVSACASGEEAYTLAILFLEEARAAKKELDIKIFATDTAERSLAQARAGLYPNGIEGEMSPERLETWFERDDAVYRVKKEVRQLVVFAPQNVLQDPPFSRLDLCCCRNLLIYLEPDIQRRVLAMMHFGLREEGALFLGSSETVGTEELFAPLDKKARLFRRVGAPRRGIELPAVNGRGPGATTQDVRVSPRSSFSQLASRALIDRYAPAAVVIDRQQNIVYFHGDTAPFLMQPTGEPTRELLAQSRDGVRGAVRIALQRSISSNDAATVRDGTLASIEGPLQIAVTVLPLESRPTPDFYLVAFEARPATAPALPEEGLPRIERAHLEDELERVRDELQSTIEELQTSNEEMRATNEEVTSINEELQSTNEELETSKEELQSLNEELTTVNAQLQVKMEELESTTNDLASLLSSTAIAVLFLDTRFRIRRFTPAVSDLFDLIPSDIGRPLSDLAWKFSDTELLADAASVLDRLVPIERDIASSSGRGYVRRALPYRTTDNRIDGVVIVFLDVSDLKLAVSALAESEERLQLASDAGGIGTWELVMGPGEFAWDERCRVLLGFPPDTSPDIEVFVAAFRKEDADRFGRYIGDLGEHGTFRATFRLASPVDGVEWVECSGRAASGTGARSSDSAVVRGTLLDVTSRKRQETAMETGRQVAEIANVAKEQFLASISHELRTPAAAILLWARMLRENPSPESLREGLDAIVRTAEAQKQLVEELLDITRISTHKLRLQLSSVDVLPVVQAAIDALSPAAREAGVTLSTRLDPEVGTARVDPDRLRQIVWNLLTNAIKFTPPKGRVRVELRGRVREIAIRVSDTGKGISAEALPRVFERFTQGDLDTTALAAGLGLGLAITRELVELHGGTIEASSRGAGGGASFLVRIPRKAGTRRASRKEAAARAERWPLSGRQVLLVSGSAESRVTLAGLVAEAGMEVELAGTLAEALGQFRQRRPEAIVCDLGLPGGEAYALLREIRTYEAERRDPPVPVVALTEVPEEGERREAMTGGFQGYLGRAMASEGLVAVLKGLLG